VKRFIGLALVLVLVLVLAGSARATNTATLDDLTLPANSYWNGGANPGAGGFTSGSAWFNNHYEIDLFSGWAFWGGWAYSNVTDNTAPGYGNQYSAIAGGGQSSQNYGVAYIDTFTPTIPTLTFASPATPVQAYFTNTTYAYLYMHDGNDGSSFETDYDMKFGGITGNDPDWFLLTITGKDAADAETGKVYFYLADFRFADNTKDYIVSNWTPVDLLGLGTVKSVEFTLSSSDTGDWGMNTPAYFAMDTFIAVPEPATLSLLGLGILAALRRRIAARGAKHE